MTRSSTLEDAHQLYSSTIHIGDADALARIAGFLDVQHKQYRILLQSDATFSDFQADPFVLIGLLNNQWTQRFASSLPFTVERQGWTKAVIQDRRHGTATNWSIDYSTPLANVTKDYAIVARMFEPTSEQAGVTVAGLSVFGTLTASEFLTNSTEIRKLDHFLPHGWGKKNIEVVLSTDVIGGHSGQPHIEAAEVWQ